MSLRVVLPAYVAVSVGARVLGRDLSLRLADWKTLALFTLYDKDPLAVTATNALLTLQIVLTVVSLVGWLRLVDRYWTGREVLSLFILLHLTLIPSVLGLGVL